MLNKQTQAISRHYANGHYGPQSQGPIPGFGDAFGLTIAEVAINANSFVPFPVNVKPGQALSWFNLSADTNGDFGPFGAALSHSDASTDGAIAYGAFSDATAPVLRFKDAKAGNDDASNPRVPTDIDPNRPLFLLVWSHDGKPHKPAIAFRNGNSPAGGGTPG